jgi:hypothetical protein
VARGVEPSTDRADAWDNWRPFQFESTSGDRYHSERMGDVFCAAGIPGGGLVSWPKPLDVMPAAPRRLPFQSHPLPWVASRSALYPPSLPHRQ